ncbi:DUF262 domain-containing protein [Candidatus Saccharibacteria bacterium]|nr:DUF262 domain-containing protein [Candidatus Saccharibacteria bacterium]
MSKELFESRPTKLGNLVSDVRTGRTGLPDLQRPFEWSDSKVRDLYDSMFRGYPIGYVMLWESPDEYDDKKKAIGVDDEKIYKKAKNLIIDGQQRLTALVASMYGVMVLAKDHVTKREIKISFNPQIAKFEVWTSAYDKDPEWVPKISEVFLAKENNTFPDYRAKYIAKCNESRKKKGLLEFTSEEIVDIENNFNDLLNLTEYSLPSLEIHHNTDEEDTAEIFVRTNSGGTKLTEKDFIKTLLSVYDNEVDDKIEKFCKESRISSDKTSYNPLIELEYSHLISMSIGVAFRRARLKYAYMMLRGKNLETGEVTPELREENLSKFRAGIDMVMDINDWHNYINICREAGYIDSNLISSKNALVYIYVIYLIAKYDYKLDVMDLRSYIRRWFFVSMVTGYYTGSPETDVEKMYADLRNVYSADDFKAYFDKLFLSNFSNDYIRITLPMELNTSASVSPQWNAYLASQVVLGYPLLFSTMTLQNYLTEGASGEKKAIDKHHIFPRDYLEDVLGIDDVRDRNQVANFTYIDYDTNITISNDPPSVYVPKFREKLGEQEFGKVCAMHALPVGFETMEYFDFLEKRRGLMAEIIAKAYDRLCGM